MGDYRSPARGWRRYAAARTFLPRALHRYHQRGEWRRRGDHLARPPGLATGGKAPGVRAGR